MNTQLELDKVKLRQRFLELEAIALKAAIEMAEFGIDHDIKREHLLVGIIGLKNQLKQNHALKMLGDMAVSMGEALFEQESKKEKS